MVRTSTIIKPNNPISVKNDVHTEHPIVSSSSRYSPPRSKPENKISEGQKKHNCKKNSNKDCPDCEALEKFKRESLKQIKVPVI